MTRSRILEKRHTGPANTTQRNREGDQPEERSIAGTISWTEWHIESRKKLVSHRSAVQEPPAIPFKTKDLSTQLTPSFTENLQTVGTIQAKWCTLTISWIRRANSWADILCLQRFFYFFPSGLVTKR
jgi:hypothetical protein